MKKILFVLQSARSGGSTTSLLNLIQLLDKKKLDISVFFMENEGTFINKFQESVQVVPEEKIISSITCSAAEIKKRGVLAFLIRVSFVILHHIFGKERTENWFYRLSARRFNSQFDTVVAFQESKVTEYVRFIKAAQKIAWVHCDYDRFAIGKSIEMETMLYNEYSKIVCVSNYARDSIIRNLKINKNKVKTIYNTVPINQIRQLSQSADVIQLCSKYVFISVGRFVPVKGFDKVVYIAKRMKDKNLDFKWILVGDGPEFNKIDNMIKKENLEDYVMMVGNQENPYKYMKLADYYICTSICETHPMVVLEALSLGKPVLSTEYPSVHEVLEDGKNGIVFPNSAEGLWEGIESVLENDAIAATISNGAKRFIYDNDLIIKQVYDILD